MLASLRTRSAAWLFAELVVVVLGILIAFQIEEYRDHLALREAEAHALAGIAEDLRADIRELEESIAGRSGQALAIERFLTRLQAGEGTSPEAFAADFRGAMRNRSYYPHGDTFDALRENGRVFVLSDPDLRARLTTHHGRPRERLMIIQSVAGEHWAVVKRLAGPDVFFAAGSLDPERFALVPFGTGDGALAVRLPVADAPRNPELVPELGNMHAALINLVRGLEVRRARAEALLAEVTDGTDERS